MVALSRHAEQNFHKNLRLRLSAVLDGEEWPPHKIEQHINTGLSRAKTYGFIRSEAEIAEYIEIVCRYLGGFGRAPHSPEVMLILFDRSRQTAARLARLRAWCEGR